MDMRRLRTQNNLTQDQMADRLKVSRITIARIESGNVNVKIGFVCNLMKEFSLTIYEAFKILQNTSKANKSDDVVAFEGREEDGRQ